MTSSHMHKSYTRYKIGLDLFINRMSLSLEKIPTAIPFQHLHLLDSYLIEFDKSLALLNTLIDKYSIDILHI